LDDAERERIAAEIVEELKRLINIAEAAQLPFLAYLLDMALTEARGEAAERKQIG
jgi:hypothetical protein